MEVDTEFLGKCRFCFERKDFGMKSLHCDKWPNAEATSLYELVTGEELPNAACLPDSWCTECLEELRFVVSLMTKFRQSGDTCRRIIQQAEESRMLKEEEESFFNSIIEIEIEPDASAEEPDQEFHDQDDYDGNIVPKVELVWLENEDLQNAEEEIQHDEKDKDLSGEWNGAFERFIDSEILKLDDNEQAPGDAGAIVRRSAIDASTPLPTMQFPTCDYCQYRCETKNNLLHHMRRVHPQCKWPCPQCSQSFVSKSAVWFHQQIAHEDILRTQKDQQELNESVAEISLDRSSSAIDTSGQERFREDTSFEHNNSPGQALRYEFAPGYRLNSRVLYTLDEKQMYRRVNSYPDRDRYVCAGDPSRLCRASVNLFRDDNVVRKTRSAVHNHDTVEHIYAQNKSTHAAKLELIASAGFQQLPPVQITDDEVIIGALEPLMSETMSETVRTESLTVPKFILPRFPVIECDLCGLGYERRAELMQHFRDSHLLCLLRCSKCSMRYKTMSGLRNHYKASHGPIPTKRVGHTPSEPLRYEYTTGRNFNGRLIYTLDEQHLYSKHSTIRDQDVYKCYMWRKIRCRVEARQDKNTGELRHYCHSREHNHPTMESTYLKNKFVAGMKRAILDSDGRMNLNELMAKHQKIDPIGAGVTGVGIIRSTLRKMKNNVERMSVINECNICFERFDETDQLLEHRAIVHPSEPNSCLLCPKSFSTPLKLQRHVDRVHLRPSARSKGTALPTTKNRLTFQCPVCAKIFKETSTLFIYRHMLIHKKKEQKDATPISTASACF